MSLHDRSWVWNPDWNESRKETSAGGFVHFRREIDLEKRPSRPIFISITADTRYKLYINSKFVHHGPVKGDSQVWYYDELDIQPYMKAGKNTIAVRVLRLYHGTRFGTSFPRMPLGGLRIQHIRDSNDPPIIFSIETNGSWKTAVDRSSFLPIIEDDMFLHIFEAVDRRNDCKLRWTSAKPHKIFNAFGLVSPWKLSPRQIPFANFRPAIFSTIHNIRSTSNDAEVVDWQACLLAKSSNRTPVRLAAGTIHHVELEASHHLTAFMSFLFERPENPGAEIKITYSECYEDVPDNPQFRQKADRRDTSKKLLGPYDTFILGGRIYEQEDPSSAYHESGEDMVIFAPFHFRTFRFIAIDIAVNSDSDLIFHGVQITRTKYPLDVLAQFSPGGRDVTLPVQKMWETSILTLENCMHDCYEDCPFYEQLQYAMDTRSSALFTYYLSGDDRLARQAITQTRNSFQPSIGLTASRAPCEHLQIIPNFSLFWICMVADHYLHYGDMAFTSQFLPVCDAVLDSFRRRIDPDLGLVRCYDTDDFWDFVDWTEAWKPRGIPPAGKRTGYQTFSSSLYAYTLNLIAPAVEEYGRKGVAEEYRQSAAEVAASIWQHCFDGQYFTDGLAGSALNSEYSQHNQVWAILSGAVIGDEARQLLSKTLSRHDLTTPSIAMSFYTLQAVSLVGGDLYDLHFNDFWAPWIEQLSNNVTTWVEDNVSQRSECHAWGSASIYEFMAEVVGLRPLEPGWRSISFKPRLALFETMDSKVPIPIRGSSGMAVAHVRWGRKGDDIAGVTIELKKGAENLRIPITLSHESGEDEVVISPFARDVRIQ